MSFLIFQVQRRKSRAAKPYRTFAGSHSYLQLRGAACPVTARQIAQTGRNGIQIGSLPSKSHPPGTSRCAPRQKGARGRGPNATGR